MLKTAVLLTCYNRRKKTIVCLQRLFNADLPINYKLEVFLVDDMSTDGTSDFVKNEFPIINIIQGNGNLYWNQGMRLAWTTAAVKKEYDYFLWLNDDSILDKFALVQLFSCYNEIFKTTGKHSIISGAFKNSNLDFEFSYGGRSDSEKPLIPNGKIQKCTYINGNAVLVPKQVYDVLGNLSDDYTHAMGDFDYGLRAREKGIGCYTTRIYIGVCPKNEGVPSWSDPKTPLKKRWELLHSPRGLNLTEYNIFRRKHFGHRWIFYAIKVYVKAVFPKSYHMFKF